MQCDQCDHQNPAQAKFCLECGAALGRRCPRCATPLPPQARFCLECGAALDAAGPTSGAGAGAAVAPTSSADLAARFLSARTAVESERRHVTVLFADVANFTPLAERLDPETVHGIMDGCFRLLMEVVHRYEGSVNQFTGDGIMALFGAPVAHEDTPERAVRAALDMQRALARYATELEAAHGIEFRVRIGVHTGPVVVGSVGAGDYTALGDTTNLAARLQTAAKPGSVLISDETARHVAGRFATRAVGPLKLKGKAHPVHAFEVVRALPRAPLLPASERGLTPLVGRTAELTTLRTILGYAAGGRGQAVFVVGEAGLGKSRVIHEFRRRLATTEITWLEGRCVSFGREFPLLPIIDVFKGRLGIDESDGEAAIIDKIHRGIAALGPELADTEPYVRALLAVDAGDPEVAALDASARRFAIFEALKRLILAAAARRPQVILIEDLHWIDPASDEFLVFIANALATARVLLLCTYRPGYRSVLAERSYATRLALQPLSREETAAMAAGAVETGELPAEIRALIADKAEGNPFFIEEVTKSLIEMEALVPADGGYALARPIDEIVIPNTIQDVILARIDRLGEGPKRALQIASVIGREFAVRLLQRATDFGEHVDRLVGELRALELVYEKSGVPELAYMFKHALTHDVAYESLLVQRRKELHRIIGAATEELYADRLTEHWETLAHHFYRGEDWPKAFTYLAKAGDKARRSFANREALHYFDRALEVADRVAADAAERATLLRGKAQAHFGMSEFPEAVDAFRRTLDLTSDAAEREHLTVGLAWAMLWAHEMDAAIALASDIAPRARTRGDVDLESSARFLVGFAGMSRGEIDTCAPHYTEALALSTRAGARGRAAVIRGFVGLVANWRGDYAEALSDVEASFATLKAENALHDLAMLYSTITITLGGAGQYARALTLAQQGIALSESMGERAWRARTWNTRGWILAELGDVGAAEEANRRCIELAAQLGSLQMAPELVGNAETNLGDLALARGDLPTAARHLGTVAAIIEDPRKEWMAWRYGMHYHLSAAELAMAHGDLGRARASIDACLETARRTRSRRYLVRATRLLAACHLAAGETEQAVALLARAAADARALANPPQLWHTLVAYGRALDRQGKRDEAMRAWQEARAAVDTVDRTLPEDVRATFARAPIRAVLGELGV